MTRTLGWIAAVAALATMVAGCAPSSGQAPPAAPGAAAPGTTAPSSEPAATTATGQATDDAAAVLPDGRSPVRLTTIDVGGYSVTFDLLVMYTGTNAAAQWLKDHPGQTEAPPLNGLYIINNNPKLRTLPVSTGVVVKVVASGDPSHPTVIAFSALPGFPEAYHNPFWITVKGGVVTVVEEQFVS